jgi:hypothetical protein
MPITIIGDNEDGRNNTIKATNCAEKKGHQYYIYNCRRHYME